jgi:hypothetical protein
MARYLADAVPNAPPSAHLNTCKLMLSCDAFGHKTKASQELLAAR